MDLFLIVWLTTTILGVLTEASTVMDICKQTAEEGYKINESEFRKIILPTSILLIPIFNLSFITLKQFKYMYFPLWNNLSEIESDNLLIPLTNEEQLEYKLKPTNFNAMKITLKLNKSY